MSSVCMPADIVCDIVFRVRGERVIVSLARRGDPVRGLDKTLRMRKVGLSDISGLHCMPRDPVALTTRAAEGVTALLGSLLR